MTLQKRQVAAEIARRNSQPNILKGRIDTREVWLNDKPLNPERSLKIRNHSPDGFMWGYGGSGPAQLALAVCLELFSDRVAQRVYQDFKWLYIAKIPQADFQVDLGSIVSISYELYLLHPDMEAETSISPFDESTTEDDGNV